MRSFAGDARPDRFFLDFGQFGDRALAAPAGEHRVGILHHEEARSLSIIAICQQMLVIGVDVPDMAAEREPERGRRRQILHVAALGQGDHGLGIGERNPRRQRPERLADRLLSLRSCHGPWCARDLTQVNCVPAPFRCADATPISVSEGRP